MSKTKIEWAEMSWNPIAGCTKCSPGCQNCYAERMAIRLNGIFAAKGDNDNWCKMTNVLKWDMSQIGYEFGKATGWNGQIELFHNRLDTPLHWRKPRRIFVCSMSDLFHPKVPFEFIAKVWDIMFECHQHVFLILTKRIKRAKEYCKWLEGEKYRVVEHFNIHFGVSISNQAEADEKIPILLQIPAAVRFVSIEPMLESIDLTKVWWETNGLGELHENFNAWVGLNGVIVGCESGPKRRPCKTELVRNIVDQCAAVSIPCFVKQININGKVSRKPEEWPEDLRIRQLP